ncbi:MAG: metallophosphoesterase [Pseudomonadota bacterium]|nr:metallophosphoesterase [Pseudomonadota bacterium]
MADNGDIILVHSSDLHIDHQYGPDIYGGVPTKGLQVVLEAAQEHDADAMLVAGDMFENNRQPQSVLADTAALLEAATMPVVILPGNHDPMFEGSAYVRAGLGELDGVHILGLTHDKAVYLELLDLEVWGHAHRDYGDMAPLREPAERSTRWQVVMAHGHYEPAPDRDKKHNAAWLIGDDEIEATGADYVALGHWNRAARVGNGGVQAYYSGSPDLAGTVNVVRLGEEGVHVTRAPLCFDP